MFGKKLVLIAAAVALATGSVAATSESAHVKVEVATVHGHKQAVVRAHAHAVKQVSETAPPSDEDSEDDDSTDEDSTEKDDDSTEDEELDIEVLAGSDAGSNSSSVIEFCLDGWTEVSVDGVDSLFCVEGTPCTDSKEGECPAAQEGLEYGSYCAVKEGGKGCKPKTKEMWEKEQDEDSEDSEEGSNDDSEENSEDDSSAAEDDEDSSADDDEEDSEEDSSAADEEDESEESEDAPATKKSHHKKSHKKDACAAGQSPMSVEGVEGVFCVSGQSCVAEIKGACPGPQANLQYGAYCDRVKTGVMGCKPKTKEMWEAEQKGGNTGGQCNGAGQSPMSVEGVEGIFCVSGQACVANIDGACPGPQAGLPYGSSCGIVKTGVKGCKPNAAPKKHHKKSHKKLRVVKKHSKN